jgi:ABC-2 type transport system ATP-binding protein
MGEKESALFEARDARIDTHGVPCVDGLSLASQGTKVAVLGAPQGLFEAAAGVLRPSRGEVRVLGEPARDRLARNEIAGAPLDPPLPPAWSARRYVECSARLAGKSGAEARQRAKDAMAVLRMDKYAETPFRSVAPAVRRAAVLAAALATGPKVVVLEDPMRGLDEPVRRSLGHMVAEALRPYSWILFSGRLPLDAPLALEAEWAVVISGSRPVAEGQPAEIASRDGAFAVRLAGDRAAFVELLRSRGVRVDGAGESLTVDLGRDVGTGDLLRMAEETRTLIVELRPLAGAFG